MADATTTPMGGFFTNWRQNIIYIGFVLIFVVFALTLSQKGFLNPTNLLNIIRQTAMIAVMAVAMTFVLASGEIDLSIGAVAGLATVTVAMAIAVAGPVAGVLAGLATGIAVGCFNGFLTTKVGIPSFLTTLAMMGIAKGVAMWISATAAVPILSPRYSWTFGGGSIGPIPVLLFWMLVVGAIGHFVLRRTGFGRRVLATGGGETAARYSGIDTAGIKFKVLVLSSTAAALAGMLYAGRLQSGRFQPLAEKTAAYSRHLYDIATGSVADFSKTFEGQATDAQKKFMGLVDNAAKNAPAGSEAAVAIMKSSVAAANNALESVQKAVKQATEVAEANFNAVAANATNVTKQATKKR